MQLKCKSENIALLQSQVSLVKCEAEKIKEEPPQPEASGNSHLEPKKIHRNLQNSPHEKTNYKRSRQL